MVFLWLFEGESGRESCVRSSFEADVYELCPAKGLVREAPELRGRRYAGPEERGHRGHRR